MIKNATLYALARPLYAAELLEGLEKRPFGETTIMEMSNSGWVPPFAGGELVHTVDQVRVIALRVDTKVLPASAVALAVRAKALQIEEQQGYKVGRRQAKEIKELVIDEMLAKAFSRTTITRVYLWDDLLLIDSGSPTVADAVMGHLARCINPFPAQMLHFKTPPAGAMTTWLADDEAPANFSIDLEAELLSAGAGRALVKFVRTPVPLDQIADRQCIKLAMTYADRLSFLLTDGFVFKRFTALDVLKEGREDYFESEMDRIDGEIVLITREIRNAIDALVSELGLREEELV